MKIPANRLAVLTGLLTALGGFLVTLLGAIDTIEKALVLCVALVVAAAVLIVYLLGWQRYEARKAFKPTTTSGSSAGASHVKKAS